MNTFTNNRIFTGSTLKLIAIITMFLDHFGAVVVGQGLLSLPSIRSDGELYGQIYLFYRILRYIGRLAFPIFCFLLVEGFLHTRNRQKYLLRLGLFTLVSEIPFDLAIYDDWFYPDKQNVFFTLFFGMLVMILADRIKNEWGKLAIMGFGIALGYFFQTDYGARGVFLICLLYLLRYSRPLQCFGGSMVMLYELTGPLGFVPVLLYNGQKGNMKLKYFFYWFYPLHLLLLAGIRSFLLSRS